MVQRAAAVGWRAERQRGPKTDAQWQGLAGEARRCVIFGDLSDMHSVPHWFRVWPWRSRPACFSVLTYNSLHESVSVKAGRALCDAQVERDACSLGLRIGWHLKAYMTSRIYDCLPVRRAGAFSSSDDSGTEPGVLWLLWLSHLRSWTKIQFLTNTAVTLIPKPAAEQLQWLPTWTGKWEVYPTHLSFSILTVSKGLILIWKTSVSLYGVCLFAPQKPFVPLPFILHGVVACLCADNHSYPQSSWKTLSNHHQKPPAHVVGMDSPTSTPPLVTNCRSSQARVKWVILISWMKS